MRQISRPTGGLYEPPTLHIYFSFSLLLLLTSSVWPFRSSFRASTQICNIFSLHFLLPSLLLPLPAFTPLAFPFQNCFVFVCFFFFFLGSDMCNCRAEQWPLKRFKGNGYQWWYLAAGYASTFLPEPSASSCTFMFSCKQLSLLRNYICG